MRRRHELARDPPHRRRGGPGPPAAVDADHARHRHRRLLGDPDRRPRPGRPGRGAQTQIDALGSNLLVVSPGSTTSRTGVRGGFGSASTLTLADAEAIADTDVVPDVERVAPVTTSLGRLVNGTPTGPPRWSAHRRLARGPLADAVQRAGSSPPARSPPSAPVVVLGADTAGELFTGGSRSVRPSRVNGTTLTVIGVLATSGSSSADASQDDTAVDAAGHRDLGHRHDRHVGLVDLRRGRRPRTRSARPTRRSTRCC